MKPDAEYLKTLLGAFRNAPDPTTDIEELKEAGIDYEEPIFEFHIESELGPREFGLSRSVDGYLSWSVIPLRLTATGHEFAEGLENPKAFETVRKDFVGASLSTIKDVVVGVIKAEISKHTGLHF